MNTIVITPKTKRDFEFLKKILLNLKDVATFEMNSGNEDESILAVKEGAKDLKAYKDGKIKAKPLKDLLNED
jgi:hypothetical protein